MLKKKRNNQRKSQPKQQKQPTGNNQNNANAAATPAPETKPVTVEDIAASILIGSSCNVISVSMTEKALSALPAETALFISNTLACRLFAQSREMSSGVISPPDL